MGRLPFYAYPTFPYSSYASPAQASFHRPFSPPFSSAPRSGPSSRSVINIPVHDSTSSQPFSSPSAQPLPAAVPNIDPSSAAISIQSHFRGFCVRRHHPLLHLRTIARARKQLEELQSELERPEFSLKVRESEKERLRLSESIMAIILRLDAIEGSMAEVRSQRKEVTKMAIKLQEAMDAIMMQKDEIAALDPTADEGDMILGDDPALIEQPQEPLHPEIDMVDMVSANGTTDLNTLQEKHLSPEENAAGICMPNIYGNGVMDMGAPGDVSLLPPCDMEDIGRQRESGSGSPHGNRSPTLQRHGHEEHSNAQAHEEKSSDGNKVHACTLSAAETPSAVLMSNASVHQLSEDCRQLKSLVGKLLVQNKAQSNILGALADRLEMLEHQQLHCQHNQQRMHKKRKLKKGSKRSVKRRSCEECRSS